jgi:branched-chain amino acid transport system permease protein
MNRHVLLVAVLVLAALPFASGSPFLVNLATLTALSAALGQSWNIAGGFGGLTSFGHVAFFGLGAYAAAIAQTRFGLSPWAGLPLAALVGGAAGGVIGAVVFRAGLRGSYFALVTLAVAETLRILATSLDITGGGSGLYLRLHVSFASMQFADRRVAYGMTLGLLALGTAVAQWLTTGRFGARLAAVRESEDAARALGVRVVRVKSQALAISGALAAMGGVLYVQNTLYLDPNIAFSPDRSVEMLLVAMVGGAGTVLGPILGAIVLHAIDDTTRTFISVPGAAPMLFGGLLLVIIRFLPGGLARLGARRARA